jgi:hypothetical protein
MSATTELQGAVDRATVPCIICQTTVPLAAVTAGSLHADGRPAFVCQAHIKQRSSWIVGWAYFDAGQQLLRDVRQLAQEAD